MARIVTYADYRDYFRSLALGLKKLCPDKVNPHFYEFENHFKGTGLKYPAMIIPPPVCQPVDGLSDNWRKRFTGEIAILGQVKKESTTDRHNRLVELEAITEQIIAKMKADHLNYDLLADRPFNELPFDQMEYSQVGPENEDNLFGYNLEFVFLNPLRYSINSTYWHG